MARSLNLIEKLHRKLSLDEATVLRAVVAQAEQQAIEIYAVGGTARDLLLEVEALDLDIAVEGDAIALAHGVAELCGARVVKATRFGTATLKLGQASVDVATTRRETYARGGALPDTDSGAIEDDLLRRDFTINAVAVRLGGAAAGQVLDPAGGRTSLRDGVIRVLHDGSLRDDPTRMIRAVRYEQRLGFAIHTETEALIGRDLHTLDSVSGTRIRQEIERTMREDRREAMLLRMDGLGILPAIHPALRFGVDQAAALRRLRGSPYDSMLSRWAIVSWTTPEEQVDSLCARLAPSGRLRDVLRSLPVARAAAREIDGRSLPSEVAARLRALPVPSVAALACAANEPPARERANEFLDHTRYVRPSLTGDDLIAIGVKQGPEVGMVLSRLRDARIDGRAASRDDELAIVKREVSERNVPVVT